MSMLDLAVDATKAFIEQKPKSQRKAYCQFFTSKESAVFMASLFDLGGNGAGNISILDPGAGSGLLSIALLERLQSCPEINSIELVCFEPDTHILPLLKANLEAACSLSTKKVAYEIVQANYILSQADAYQAQLGTPQASESKLAQTEVTGDSLAARLLEQGYDVVIANPPYLKLSKLAPEAQAMSDVCHGAPNMYFLFMAMSLFNLKAQGQMVYIIPRSWTSGAYFRAFRDKLFAESALEHIHLFVSRSRVFEQESVLQETMIIKVRKTGCRPAEVTISSTLSNADFSSLNTFRAPYSLVVSAQNSFVFLVTNNQDVAVLQRLNALHNTLLTLGLKMKTGLTVDFRHQDLLRDAPVDNAVPLFYAHHLQNGKVVFPSGQAHEYISTNRSGLLQANRNYLFVKRFTSKEESRRLQCAIYLSRNFPDFATISTQNKLNFIDTDGEGELSPDMVYGLYALFNSSLYDAYYRILNGSTQVNSTEINTMPVPDLEVIEAMGRELATAPDLSAAECDRILCRYV